MFPADSIVRSRNDPPCAGQITGLSATKAERDFLEVLLLDRGGKRRLPDTLLNAGTAAPDQLGYLTAGKFADTAPLRRMPLHLRLTGRLS